MLFVRLFTGYMVQVLPCAFLTFYASLRRLRFPVRRLAGLTAALLIGLAAVFAGAGLCLQRLMPPDETLFNAVNLVFCATLLPCLLWFLFAVTAPWQKKLFVFSFTITGSALAAIVSNTFVSSFPMAGATDGLPYRSWAMLSQIAFSAAIAVLSFLIIKYFYLPVEDKISPAENVYLSLLSVLALVLMTVLVIGFSTNEYNVLYRTSLFLYLSLIVTVLVIYVVLFRVIAASYDKLAAQQEAGQARNLLTLQEEQYQRISDNIESSRRMRHDLRHHMILLQGFLQQGETERAAAYVENYLNTEKQDRVVWLCGNHTVNAVVSHYQAMAVEQGMGFTAHISVPDKLDVRNEDMAVLLGNLLENAIEAGGSGVERRQIRFKMALSGGMLAIAVDNRFDGCISMDGGQYVSTKGQHRGIGLQSIRAIAETYGGFAEFSHEKDVFHSAVMLTLSAGCENTP